MKAPQTITIRPGYTIVVNAALRKKAKVGSNVPMRKEVSFAEGERLIEPKRRSRKYSDAIINEAVKLAIEMKSVPRASKITGVNMWALYDAMKAKGVSPWKDRKIKRIGHSKTPLQVQIRCHELAQQMLRQRRMVEKTVMIGTRPVKRIAPSISKSDAYILAGKQTGCRGLSVMVKVDEGEFPPKLGRKLRLPDGLKLEPPPSHMPSVAPCMPPSAGSSQPQSA